MQAQESDAAVQQDSEVARRVARCALREIIDVANQVLAGVVDKTGPSCQQREDIGKRRIVHGAASL